MTSNNLFYHLTHLRYLKEATGVEEKIFVHYNLSTRPVGTPFKCVPIYLPPFFDWITHHFNGLGNSPIPPVALVTQYSPVAQCTTVWCSSSLAFTSAPAASRVCTSGTFPCTTAKCRGVSPSASLASASAGAAINTRSAQFARAAWLAPAPLDAQ